MRAEGYEDVMLSIVQFNICKLWSLSKRSYKKNEVRHFAWWSDN